jgi:hypothetical protein
MKAVATLAMLVEAHLGIVAPCQVPSWWPRSQPSCAVARPPIGISPSESHFAKLSSEGSVAIQPRSQPAEVCA